MPSPDPAPTTVPTAALAPAGGATAPESTRHLTLAWAWLAGLSLLSVLASGASHQGLGRLIMTLLVAAIAWAKARVLIRHYLEAQQAGPVFHRIVMTFAALAPLALGVSAVREWLSGG